MFQRWIASDSPSLPPPSPRQSPGHCPHGWIDDWDRLCAILQAQERKSLQRVYRLLVRQLEGRQRGASAQDQSLLDSMVELQFHIRPLRIAGRCWMCGADVRIMSLGCNNFAIEFDF